MISPTAAGWADIAKSVLSALVMGAAVRFVYDRVGAAGSGRLVGFAVSVPAGVLVYALCTLLSGSGETRGLIGAVREKRGGKKA